MRKLKLTNEELLAGHCLPKEMVPEKEDDPRLHSPDEFLDRALMVQESTKKSSLVNGKKPEHILKGTSQYEDKPQKKVKPKVADQEKPHPNKEMPIHVDNGAHSIELENLKKDNQKEIDKWKRYEAEVKDWKDQVFGIMTKLKMDLAEAQDEIKRLKEEQNTL